MATLMAKLRSDGVNVKALGARLAYQAERVKKTQRVKPRRLKYNPRAEPESWSMARRLSSKAE